MRRCLEVAPGVEVGCPLCGLPYLPNDPMQFLCEDCHRRLLREGLTWHQRVGRVLAAKIKALNDAPD